MGAAKNGEVNSLLGDFFEYHTSGDRDSQNATLRRIEKLLDGRDIDSDPFKEYFNNIYSGRSSFNINLTITDYPKESVIRELLQNTFGCYYDEKDIKVVFEFLDDGQIKLTYNEVGFTLEQIFYYLSIGRNDGDRRREGRFGLGSKSVFLNVEWFKLRSNNFNFEVINDNGTIKIINLDLTAQSYKGTEIIFKVSNEDQKRIRQNLLTISSAKGDYINMAEFAFAFLKKRYLNKDDKEETLDRTFNIAVMTNGKPDVVYRVIRYQKNDNDIPRIRFIENGKSVLEFIWHENNGFVYVIPFAVSSSKREDLVKVLLAEYNYFSTFELTGLMKVTGEEFIREKLTAFFISVPNTVITSHRSGIKVNMAKEVSTSISFDLLSMIDKYRDYFILELLPRQNSDRYFLRPKHYVFEFFHNYIQSSQLTEDVKNKFNDNVSLYYPDVAKPITYTELRKTGYFRLTENVSKEEHDSNEAYTKYLVNELEKAQEDASALETSTLAVIYTWATPDKSESGREYIYQFTYGGKKMLLESEKNPAIQDFNLWEQFSNFIMLKLAKYIENDSIHDEVALENVLKTFDDMFGDDYRIDMRYFQLTITHHNVVVNLEISRINVGNIFNAYQTVSSRERRFENHQIYSQIIALIVNSFTNGKDTMTFLRQMKLQGTQITLVLDINKRYRFSAFGKQFMIPPNISNADLLEIIGDIYSLISCGMFNGKLYDFEHKPVRYVFDKTVVANLLSSKTTEEKTADVLSKLYVCDLNIDKIAVIDNEGKIFKITGMDEELNQQDVSSAAKLVVLRDNLPKSKFSCYLEFLLTGKNDRILNRFYSSSEEPNQILLDQIPYSFKPLPVMNKDEFEYLRQLVRQISELEKTRVYKNYFAKDVNSKLFGYGGSCSVCDFDSQVLNSFTMKQFEVGFFKDDKEEKFKFSLYLCANHAFASSGWIIDSLSIGGMTPYDWIEEMTGLDFIPPEFLFARVKYHPQITYDLPGKPTEQNSVLADDNVYEAEQEILDVTLSPLLAAKWYEDNI